MRFIATAIEGAFVVELDAAIDERGSFARTFCRETFRTVGGIDFEPVQCNISRNRRAGTLRGMHMQRAPYGEAKLVQCVRGSIFDVALDVRESSPSFGAVAHVDLTATNDRLFYIPEGCAHGFLSLEPDSDVLYYMGTEYTPGAASGIRWNDPAYQIPWPNQPQAISERDMSWPDFSCPDAIP